jgi:hypothetical protein
MDYFKPLLPYHRTGKDERLKGALASGLVSSAPLPVLTTTQLARREADPVEYLGRRQDESRASREAANERASELRGVFETVSALSVRAAARAGAERWTVAQVRRRLECSSI